MDSDPMGVVGSRCESREARMTCELHAVRSRELGYLAQEIVEWLHAIEQRGEWLHAIEQRGEWLHAIEQRGEWLHAVRQRWGAW